MTSLPALLCHLCRAMALCVALAPMSAMAEPPALLPAAEQPAWNAIGRVNIAGLKRRGMCTGTLVAPDIVLTAAHCLFRSDARKARPQDVHFVAGWRSGAFVAHRVGAELHLHPEYDPNVPPIASRMLYDIAFVILDSPIDGDTVTPLPIAALSEDPAPLTLIGYRRERPHAASRQSDCQLTHREPGLIGTDCSVTPGASGGPVLSNTPQGWRVVALVGAAIETSNRIRSLAPLVPLNMVALPPSH